MQVIIDMFVSAIIKALFSFISKEAKEKITIAKEHVDEKKQGDKYQEVVNKPNATREERERAEDDLLNGR